MNIFKTVRIGIYLIACKVLLTSSAIKAGEFAVSPMMIEMKAASREVQEFSFTLFGKSDTDVTLKLYEMQQLESGYMSFIEADTTDLENFASWVELEDDQFRLRDGDVIKVSGELKIPARAQGSHQLAVMVEEEAPEVEQGGIAVKIRYAVVLNLNISGRYSRIDTDFGELTVVSTDQGNFIQAFFQNDSAVDAWLGSEVQLRSQNNRLVDRVVLKTESAWQRQDEGSRVFPNARVRLYGEIPPSVAPGNYNIMVRNRFAEKSQPVFRTEIILEGSTNAQEGNENAGRKGVALAEPLIPVTIRENGSSFTSFVVKNNDTEIAKLVFPSVIRDMAGHGITSFKFYPDTVTLQPGQSSNIVLRQAHEDASLYGEVTFPATVEINGVNEDFPVITLDGGRS